MRVNPLRRSWGAVGRAQARVPRPYKEVRISRNIKDFEMEQWALKFSFNLGQSSFHGGRPSPTSPRGHRNKKTKFAPSIEGKYCNISESIHFFDFRPRAKCVRLLFYPLDFPLRKHPYQLGGHEFKSWLCRNENIRFSRNFSDLRKNKTFMRERSWDLRQCKLAL